MKTHLSQLLLFLTIGFFGQHAFAQTGEIMGSVTADGETLPFATVQLKAVADSSLVKVQVSNPKGQFHFYRVGAGSYFIAISFVGFAPYQSEIIEVQNSAVNLPAIVLSSDAETLDEVTVTAERPMIEVKPDRTVFNIENTLNSTGTDGFDLLRKAPGVIIDNNDNLIVEGKTGVQIFINGKPSVLNGEDLTNFLRSLQASDIAAIEIITQPSSKYDAAGNAGIINIKLKKDQRYGTNGTLNVGYEQGRNDRYNGSISFNTRTKNDNFFGSYSNRTGDTWRFIDLDRRQSGTRFDSESETVSDRETHNFRAGWDRSINDKHTIGILAQGNFFNSEDNTQTITPIIPGEVGDPAQILIADNVNANDNQYVQGNLNYRYQDTLGYELGIDIDLAQYDRDRLSLQPNRYEDGQSGDVVLQRDFEMNTPTDINIYSSQIDYSQNLGKGKISIGAKYASVETENTFEFYDVENDERVFNTDRSNEFDYIETITAGYVNYSRKWEKWQLQVGLRAENTESEGDLTSTQDIDNQNVKRSYLDWFPSGGLTFKPHHQHSLALTYSRRIQRPNYASLNPFERQLDELSFSRGNPFLQPQYTDNVKLSHTFKYKYTTSFSYSYISDFFAEITDTLNTNQNFMMTRNVANQRVWNFGLSLPFDVAKWWSVYTSVNAYRSEYIGQDEKFVALEQNTLSFYAQNTFKLPSNFRLELSGWFSSPSVWGGTYLTKSLGSVNIALQKKFMDERLSVRVAANDIFFTSFWRADMTFGELYIDGRGGWESQHVKFNVSYAFGSKKIKSARKRKTSMDDASQRVGG